MIGLICLVAGPFAGTTEWFAHHLHSTFGFESLGHFEHHFDWVTAIVGTLAAVGGIGLSYMLYGKDPEVIHHAFTGEAQAAVRSFAEQILC